MNARYFPPCCTQPTTHWRLPKLATQAKLFSCAFTPEEWQAEHSERFGLVSMAGIAKRQAEFLAGRLCAREALVALGASEIVVTKDASRMPLWPEGTVGSITHSSGHAVALAGPVEVLQSAGIDLEKRLSHERATRLASQIHTPEEWARIEHLDLTERSFVTTLTFSLKESLYKALYPLVRRKFYFQDAELLSYQDSGLATLRLLIDLNENWPKGSTLEGQFSLDGSFLLSAVLIAQPQSDYAATTR